MINIFYINFGVYLGAFVLSVLAVVSKKQMFKTSSIGMLAFGLLMQTVYMGQRWVEAGHAPVSNTFESLVLFAWTIAVVQLVVRLKIKVPILDAGAIFMIVLTLAYAMAFESEIKPLPPALQSDWMTFHVFTCFLGYGGFAVSFIAGISFLIGSTNEFRMQKQTLSSLDVVVGKTISFGFLFLTIGILSGAVWAKSIWGDYWTWDNKEVWSLITWIIYAFFLHGRYVRGWGVRVRAWIAIIGFVAVLFTYFGVTYLMDSQHSYTEKIDFMD